MPWLWPSLGTDPSGLGKPGHTRGQDPSEAELKPYRSSQWQAANLPASSEDPTIKQAEKCIS